jgi:hypothetical protein
MVPDLPVLIGVGPVRTGTSWVHEMFFDHPEASVTRVKEVNYFRTHFAKPIEWYFDQFQPTTSRTKILVDMSPSGFGCPSVPARIRREIRNPYLLIGLRSPYERLLSCYLKFGKSYESFALFAKAFYINGFTPLSTRIREYVECAGQERIIFFPFDDLSNNPVKMSRELQSRLGLQYHRSLSIAHRINSAGMPGSNEVRWTVATSAGNVLANLAPGLKYKLRYSWPFSEFHGVISTGVGPDGRLSVADAVATFENFSVLFEPDIDRFEEILSTELKGWRLDAQCRRITESPTSDAVL